MWEMSLYWCLFFTQFSDIKRKVGKSLKLILNGTKHYSTKITVQYSTIQYSTVGNRTVQLSYKTMKNKQYIYYI